MAYANVTDKFKTMEFALNPEACEKALALGDICAEYDKITRHPIDKTKRNEFSMDR